MISNPRPNRYKVLDGRPRVLRRELVSRTGVKLLTRNHVCVLVVACVVFAASILKRIKYAHTLYHDPFIYLLGMHVYMRVCMYVCLYVYACLFICICAHTKTNTDPTNSARVCDTESPHAVDPACVTATG